MNKKSKTQPKPLEVINENPGNEESFIQYSDTTQTMPENHQHQYHSNSNPIPRKESSKSSDERPNSEYNDQNKKHTNDNKDKEKEKDKKKKKKNSPERPLINISSRVLDQDVKLLQETHENVTKKILQELKEENAPQDLVDIILRVVNEKHRRAMSKITKNIKIIPSIYSEEIVPVEIKLTGQTRKVNSMMQENLKIANSRVKAEKPVSQNIKIFTKVEVGEEADILFKDGTVMSQDEYLKAKGENPEMEKVKGMVKGMEEHLIEMQKGFGESLELRRNMNKDLEGNLKAIGDFEKSMKKKRV